MSKFNNDKLTEHFSQILSDCQWSLKNWMRIYPIHSGDLSRAAFGNSTILTIFGKHFQYSHSGAKAFNKSEFFEDYESLERILQTYQRLFDISKEIAAAGKYSLEFQSNGWSFTVFDNNQMKITSNCVNGTFMNRVDIENMVLKPVWDIIWDNFISIEKSISNE